MSGNGKGGNNPRNRHRFSKRRDDHKHDRKKHNDTLAEGKPEGKFDKNRINHHERSNWTAPVLPANPITTPDCPWCGHQIKDITTAISDKETGLPVHFDCVLDRIGSIEKLESNETVCYIGGGRFGIIHYNHPHDTRNFSIKKIYEWEVKEIHSEWRRPISEYFSLT